MAELASSVQFPFLWEGKDRKGNRLKGRGLAKSETEMRAEGFCLPSRSPTKVPAPYMTRFKTEKKKIV